MDKTDLKTLEVFKGGGDRLVFVRSFQAAEQYILSLPFWKGHRKIVQSDVFVNGVSNSFEFFFQVSSLTVFE